MKNLVKLVFGLFFTLGIYVTSYAQTDSVAPADDAIVCKQVAEDVFDCYVQEELETEEELNIDEESEGRDEDYNNRRRREERETTPGTESNEDYNKSDRYNESEIDESGIDDPINDESIRNKDNPVNENSTKTETDKGGVHMEGDRTQDDDMYEYRPDANDVNGGPNPVRL